MKETKDILVARHEEFKILNDTCQSTSAQFIAIYGRRRIGIKRLVPAVPHKRPD